MSGATAKRKPPHADGLILIEKYEAVFNYLYPIVNSFPRAHGKFRDKMLDVLLRIPGEVYLAVKLSQVGKLNILDSSLAELRWCLRFAASHGARLISEKQHVFAGRCMYEVNAIVNAMKAALR